MDKNIKYQVSNLLFEGKKVLNLILIFTNQEFTNHIPVKYSDFFQNQVS